MGFVNVTELYDRIWNYIIEIKELKRQLEEGKERIQQLSSDIKNLNISHTKALKENETKFEEAKLALQKQYELSLSSDKASLIQNHQNALERAKAEYDNALEQLQTTFKTEKQKLTDTFATTLKEKEEEKEKNVALQNLLKKENEKHQQEMSKLKLEYETTIKELLIKITQNDNKYTTSLQELTKEKNDLFEQIKSKDAKIQTLKQTNASLKENVGKLTVSMEEQTQKHKEQIKEKESMLSKQVIEINKVNETIQENNKKIAFLTNQLTLTNKLNESQSSKLNENAKTIADLNSELQKVTKENKQYETALKEEDKKNKALKQKLADAETQLQTISYKKDQEMKERTEELEISNKSLEDKVSSFEAINKKLQDELNENKQKIENYEKTAQNIDELTKLSKWKLFLHMLTIKKEKVDDLIILLKYKDLKAIQSLVDKVSALLRNFDAISFENVNKNWDNLKFWKDLQIKLIKPEKLISGEVERSQTGTLFSEKADIYLLYNLLEKPEKDAIAEFLKERIKALGGQSQEQSLELTKNITNDKTNNIKNDKTKKTPTQTQNLNLNQTSRSVRSKDGKRKKRSKTTKSTKKSKKKSKKREKKTRTKNEH